MYDGRDNNVNSQTNSSIKHIVNTYGGAQNEIYCNYIMIISILSYVLEYLIDEKGVRWIIIIIDLIFILILISSCGSTG